MAEKVIWKTDEVAMGMDRYEWAITLTPQMRAFINKYGLAEPPPIRLKVWLR